MPVTSSRTCMPSHPSRGVHALDHQTSSACPRGCVQDSLMAVERRQVQRRVASTVLWRSIHRRLQQLLQGLRFAELGRPVQRTLALLKDLEVHSIKHSTVCARPGVQVTEQIGACRRCGVQLT